MKPIDHVSDRKSGLTCEHLLWVLIALLALAMRVARLAAAPLAPGEAREAVLAWQAATGHGTPLADYNPLLFAANSLLFTLFGTSDALARLLPALFGTCLVLTPILFRHYLGRVGALASAFYLTISPVALVASRQLDGTVIAAAGALACLGGGLCFIETEWRGWLVFAALGLGLGVTSGAAVYGLLLPLALAYLILALLVERRDEPLVPSTAPLGIALRDPRVWLVFVGSVFLFATGFGWHLPGVAGAGEHLADWLGRFQSTADPPASTLALLTVYELWAVVFGLGGLVWGLHRQEPFTRLLGLWAVLVLVLLALMPGRAPTDMLWVVPPLVMLAGSAIQALARRDPSSDARLRTVHLAVVLTLWVHAYLMLGRYAWLGEWADLVLAIISVVLQTLVGLSLGLIQGAPATFRNLARGTAVALLALTLGAGWGVAYRRPADPREILFGPSTPVNVRDLVHTLEDISWQETGLSKTVSLTFQAPADSVLAWYLRDFPMARRVDTLDDLTDSEIGSLVVTSGRDDTLLATAGRVYAGQDFALQRTWSLPSIDCRLWQPGCQTAVEWFLFRDGVPLPTADRWATLWRVSETSYSP